MRIHQVMGESNKDEARICREPVSGLWRFVRVVALNRVAHDGCFRVANCNGRKQGQQWPKIEDRATATAADDHDKTTPRMRIKSIAGRCSSSESNCQFMLFMHSIENISGRCRFRSGSSIFTIPWSLFCLLLFSSLSSFSWCALLVFATHLDP